jgi:Glycosyltransferase sugar-binding region containing DXD motif
MRGGRGRPQKKVRPSAPEDQHQQNCIHSEWPMFLARGCSRLLGLCALSSVILHASKMTEFHLEQTSVSLTQLYPLVILDHGVYDNKPEPLKGDGHRHKIPNILLFTHSSYLTNRTMAKASQYLHPQLSASAEVQALHDNVQHTISLHPNATVRFLIDDDCVAALRRVIPTLNLRIPNTTSDIRPESVESMFVEYFNNEPMGMYKGDLCRGVALYETGGLYFDVDLGVRMNMFGSISTKLSSNLTRKDPNQTANSSRYAAVSHEPKLLIAPDIDFITIYEYFSTTNERSVNFFNAFMGATPRHPILKRYVELFWEFYTKQLPKDQVKANDYVGVVLLRDAYDEVVHGRSLHQPQPAASTAPQQNENESALTSNSSMRPPLRTEIWHQIRLTRALHASPWFSHVPQLYVEGGACSYAVLTSHVPQRLRQHENLELVNQEYPFDAPAYEDDAVPLAVPFYSRVPNTRRCPVSQQADQQQLSPWPPVEAAAEAV